MTDVKTCLMFHTGAEDAAAYYVSLLPDSRIVAVTPGAPGGPPVAIDFVLGGRPFLALNGRPEPGFTDACSVMVSCETQGEIDRCWDALTRGGEEGPCGWCKDRFGVSWQVVPHALPQLLGGPDPAAAGRALQAMFGMRKLDIAALERARRGGDEA